MNETPRLTVKDFNELLNSYLATMGEFIIEGEITQMTISSRGGVNLVLKDTKDQAVIAVSGFAPRIQGIKMVEEGMQVAIWGTPQLWGPSGKLSVSIYKIAPIGKGQLKEAYEKLKQKLQAEGLFDPDRKRVLPDLITNIGLITAEDSAAASDFLKILKENNARLNIDFYHTQVQGKYAEQGIINAIKQAQIQKHKYDCLVLIRGGGSLEDLMAFNEEQVARAIFASNIPIIVGVGHERDESIADFSADVRASTPSQAAYYLIGINQSFERAVEMRLENINSQLDRIIQNYYFQFNSKLNLIENSINNYLTKIRNYLNRSELVMEKFPRQLKFILEKLETYERLFASYNPSNILKRGYSLVQDKNSRVISQAAQLVNSQKVKLTFSDGSKTAIIGEKEQIDLFE